MKTNVCVSCAFVEDGLRLYTRIHYSYDITLIASARQPRGVASSERSRKSPGTGTVTAPLAACWFWYKESSPCRRGGCGGGWERRRPIHQRTWQRFLFRDGPGMLGFCQIFSYRLTRLKRLPNCYQLYTHHTPVPYGARDCTIVYMIYSRGI